MTKKIIQKGAGSKIAWDLGKTAAAALGIYGLVVDCDGLVDDFESKYAPADPTDWYWTSTSGQVSFHWYKIDAPNFWSGTYPDELKYECNSSYPLGHFVTIHSQYESTPPTKCRWKIEATVNGTPHNPESTVCCFDSDLTFYPYTSSWGPGAFSNNETYTPEQVEEYVDQNSSTILDHLNDPANQTFTSTPPVETTSTYVSPDVPDVSISDPAYTDPATGNKTDIKTGESADPVTDPDYGTYNPSPQPGDQVFDTEIVLPLQESIPDLVSGWISNAPFVAFFDDFEVTGSGAQSSFQVTTPFGNTATMDFGEFSSLYAQIAAIIVGFAYLYAIWIIFAGAV